MAKKGTRLNTVVLECTTCGRSNYVTSRSNIQPVTKLDGTKKHCAKCRAHKEHKERK